MAKSGGFENPGFGKRDTLMEHTDDCDEDTTMPFQPNGASTPGPSGEEIPMQTMQHEQSGLPEPSYAKTSFGGRNITDEEIERRLRALRNPTTGLLDTTAVGLHEQKYF